MNQLNSLTPTDVFLFFEEICKIPRPSGKEQAIIKYIEKFASERKLSCKIDNYGNILIKKNATAGMEKIPPVILQTHLDMVCEKNASSKHNFETDPIIPIIDGEWIKASGTTLGADDGIGIAMQLAILNAKDVKHGPIYCLFTTSEETGLDGAKNLDTSFFEAELLINLDSEEEGEIFIGCAGGMDTVATFMYQTAYSRKNDVAIKINIHGLKGGHSGDDIHRGHGNSIAILNRFLYNYSNDLKIEIAEITGGNLRNAIPREASAILVLPEQNKDKLLAYVDEYKNTISAEIGDIETGFEITLENVSVPRFVFEPSFKTKLINAIYACPHGVMGMSRKMPGLVETSTNLASIRTDNDNKTIIIATSQRSSVNSLKTDIGSKVKSVFELAGANVKVNTGYPGWTPNPDSTLVKAAKKVYQSLFHTDPSIKAIHAGLECGLFLDKKPTLDMISIGPTLKGVHSPDEKLHIGSVDKCYRFLLELLKNLG